MKKLQISAGIIRNAAGDIFITRRAADGQMANMWEFPGGKIEAGETPEIALARELFEEVGILPESAFLYDQQEFTVADKHIALWFWLVDSWQGEPYGKEGQPGKWVAQGSLNAADFPPANGPVIAKLLQEIAG